MSLSSSQPTGALDSNLSKQPLAGPFIMLALIGLVISAVLLYHHVELSGGFQVAPSACAIGEHFDCDKVAKSDFAEFGGVPVASYALLFYVAVFALAVIARHKIRAGSAAVLESLSALSFISLLPSLGLLAISLFSIKSLCVYCLVLDATNIALALVSVRSLGGAIGVSSLARGVKHSVRYLVTAFSHPTAAMLVLTFVAFAAVVYRTPDLLRDKYFQPRQQERFKAEDFVISAWLSQWQSATKSSLPPLVARGDGLNADFFRGAKNPEIAVVEFADYQCSHCMRAAKVVHDLAERFGDRVQFVFKNYPLDSNCNAGVALSRHEYGCHAAVMARCAGEQNRELFWDMHDALFDLTLWNSINLEQLPEQLGLDQARFASCMESEEVWNRVRADVATGSAAGVKATPTFFIVQGDRQLLAPAFPVLGRLLERLLVNEKSD